VSEEHTRRRADDGKDREPAIVRKIRDRQRTHKEHGVLYRGAFVAAGTVLLLAGAAMLVLPGPAFVVIPVGLAVLALEFTWAEMLLEKSLRQADAAKRKAVATTPLQRVLTGLAAACAAAAGITAALLWDIPLLPV
jgi:uncharacterized protein (TIGR02611 family)